MSSIKMIEKTVVDVILRPESYSADNIKSLEIVIFVLLNLREEVFRNDFPEHAIPTAMDIYRAWSKEYFGSSGPRPASLRLMEKFGWERCDAMRDHKDTWIEVVDYYKEFAGRVFRASGAEVAFERDDSE